MSLLAYKLFYRNRLSELHTHIQQGQQRWTTCRSATDPVGSWNLDYQLNSVFHEKPAIPSHHQSGRLALGRLDDRDNALDEVFRIVLVLLKHRHPLPQTASPGLLVRVRLGLHCRNFHHFWPPASTNGHPRVIRSPVRQAGDCSVGVATRTHRATPPFKHPPSRFKEKGGIKEEFFTLNTSANRR